MLSPWLWSLPVVMCQCDVWWHIFSWMVLVNAIEMSVFSVDGYVCHPFLLSSFSSTFSIFSLPIFPSLSWNGWSTFRSGMSSTLSSQSFSYIIYFSFPWVGSFLSCLGNVSLSESECCDWTVQELLLLPENLLSVILPFRVSFNPHRRKQPFCSFHYMRVTIPLTQQSMTCTFFEVNNLQRDSNLIYLLIYLSLYCFMMCPSSNSSQQPNLW